MSDPTVPTDLPTEDGPEAGATTSPAAAATSPAAVDAAPAVATAATTAPTPATQGDPQDDLDELDLVALLPAEGHSLVARLGAEALGTFAVVLAVVGTLLYQGLTSAGTLGVALAGGAALAAVTAALGHVSGAHVNPAVSVAAAVAGRIRALDAVLYVVAQVLGGVLAAAVLTVTVPSALPALVGSADAQAFVGTTANGWEAGSPLSTLSQGQVTFGLTTALLVEALATAVVVTAVLGGRRRAGASRLLARAGAPLAAGAAYAAMLLVVGPITNGGLNPARSTAVALVTLGGDGPALGQLWGFWVAPLIGAVAVGLGLLAFQRPDEEALLVDDVTEETLEVLPATR